MIRYVPIGETTEVFPNSGGFAWFDTVTDRFIEVDNDQVWKTWGEFVSSCARAEYSDEQIERYGRIHPVVYREFLKYKPCPFCDSTNIEHGDNYSRGLPYVRCTECNAVVEDRRCDAIWNNRLANLTNSKDVAN